MRLLIIESEQRYGSETWNWTRSKQWGAERRQVELSTAEYSIPEYHVRRAAAIVSQAALLRYLYGLKWEQFSSGLELHMDELRRKLDNGAAPLMRVIRGQEYLLQE